MPQFDPSSFASQIFWLIVTFVILYLLMSRVALPRIGEVLEERSERISNDLDRAEQLRKQADEVVEQYEAALSKARSEASAIMAQANQDIAAASSERQTAFQAELDKKIDEAEDRIGKARDEAMGQVRDIAIEASRGVAEKLVGKAPTEAQARKQVDAAIKQTASQEAGR
ncbi:MAG: F0F1 ATP synthase subunit B' [Azospirillaceae bacterium]